VAKTPLATECPVLHLLLGPLHLNLLGLIADLNKVECRPKPPHC
jgi:hypothetical protein